MYIVLYFLLLSSAVKKLILIFQEDFILEDSAYCRSDFVAIGGKRDSNKKRICGQQSYRIIELATPKNPIEPWILEFESESAGHQRGFSIKVIQILCSELGTLFYVQKLLYFPYLISLLDTGRNYNVSAYCTVLEKEHLFVRRLFSDLEPFVVFDADNCGVEGLNAIAGVVERQKMINDEICVYEIERKKGSA